MPVPSTNVGLSHIAQEFGGTAPHALSEYYGDTSSAPAVGSGSPIKFSHFAGEYGASFVGSQNLTPSVVNAASGYTHWTTSNGPHPGGVTGIQNGDLCIFFAKLDQIRNSTGIGGSAQPRLLNVPSSDGTFTDVGSVLSDNTGTKFNRYICYFTYDSSKSTQRIVHNADSTYVGFGLAGLLLVFRGVTTHYGYGIATKTYDGSTDSTRPDPPSVTASQECKLWVTLAAGRDGGYNNTGKTITSSDKPTGYTFIGHDRMNQGTSSSTVATAYKLVEATTEDPGMWGSFPDNHNMGITLGFAI